MADVGPNYMACHPTATAILQGAATWRIQCHDPRAKCHIAECCHQANSTACHPSSTLEEWRVHLADGSNVVVLEQEIRSVELGVCPMQHFHFLITWWKSDDFSLRYGDISIFKMTAVRHLGIVLPPYETTHEVTVKCHVNLIHKSEDIVVKKLFAYLAWNAYSGPQNLSFGGHWTPSCDYSSSRLPKGTSLRKSASFKLSTVKICW